MPSIDDVFNELQQTNTNLQEVNTAVTNGFQAVGQQLGQLVPQAVYATTALFHLSQQADTMICNLEKIAAQTCALLNEAHSQTTLQESVAADTGQLAALFRAANAQAALELDRLADLRAQVEKCCPPEQPRPACTYEPCGAPNPLNAPPDLGVIG